jgi:phosphomannomutase
MHGVGRSVAHRVLAGSGFHRVHDVAAQADPDPEFPTVAFPNPEEPGALARPNAPAAAPQDDPVVANDPDADRCAAAVPDAHGWRMLRGDEVGALLAHHLLTGGHTGTYACSIVSSTLLGKMAAAAGQPFAETLTGFKWISKVDGLVFGYEEALGYCVDPEHVKDKDGVSALLLLCELAAAEKAQGRSLVDVLDDLALAHGLHATDQLSVRVTDLAEIGAAMQRHRANPPAVLGGLLVASVDDLSRGDGGLPPTEGLRYHLADNARVIVRPSGTEPKLKCYLEVVVPVDAEAGVDAARIAAAARLDAVRSDIRSAAGI